MSNILNGARALKILRILKIWKASQFHFNDVNNLTIRNARQLYFNNFNNFINLKGPTLCFFHILMILRFEKPDGLISRLGGVKGPDGWIYLF